MKLKRYKRKTIGSYIGRELIIIILGVIMALIIINYLSKKINEVIIPMSEAITRKYITNIINEATMGIKFDGNLFTIEKSNDNEIKMITYDSYEATKLVNMITGNIQNRLDIIDKDTISEIPLGIIFNNGLLKNFGPKIKIRLNIIGDVLSELETEVKPYGINNSLVEVRVKIDANARVILPLISKDIKITNKIPISINIVNGNIPDAYIGTYK